MTFITRPVHLTEKVVFLDGISGTGKTMMAPLLGSFERVEIGKFNHLYEYLCTLDFLKRIETDATESLIKMYVDLDLYNISISREVNLRPRDLSGIFQNPHPFRYLRRLLYQDGAAAALRIKKGNPILHLISHQALSIMGPIFRALGDRVRIVEMVRHPLYLLEHWYPHIDRFGNDPRDFTVWMSWQKHALPWFAHGWEEKYFSSTSFDRIIYLFDYLTSQMDTMVAQLNDKAQRQILWIPFEHFVLEPNSFLRNLEDFLGTKMTSTTNRVLKQQRCPRRRVADGPAKEIYKRYAWKKPDSRINDAVELERKWEFARSHASSEAMTTLEKLCKSYEEKYGVWFSE